MYIINRFGNVFVGRQNGFDVYSQIELENTKTPNSIEPIVSVNLSDQLRWISVSCDGLTLMIITYKEAETNIIFYDVRSLLKKETSPFAKQSPPPSPGTVY